MSKYTSNLKKFCHFSSRVVTLITAISLAWELLQFWLRVQSSVELREQNSTLIESEEEEEGATDRQEQGREGSQQRPAPRSAQKYLGL